MNSARQTGPVSPASNGLARRAALAIVLLVALAARLWILATHTYVVWPDETFQYLEPAHRLVFGAGVITWEFLDGIRSWLLPGIVAGVMQLVAVVAPGSTNYVLVLRLLCVLASLIVPLVGFKLVERRFGTVVGLCAGLLGALASEAIYVAPAIMAEPVATDAALLAILLGDAAPGARSSRRRLLVAGLLFGLAASLRYQYAPVLAVVALVQHARLPRDLAVVAAGGFVVVVAVLGGLDWLTWGVPFQSVWLNFQRNAMDGISSAIGTQPWFYYAAYYPVAWGVAAPLLLACAVFGAIRLPVLAVAVLLTLGLHSLVPHKELRFVFLATACVPMLVGLGLGLLLQRVAWLRPVAIGAPVAAGLALAISAYTAAGVYARASPPDAWHRFSSVLMATAAARAYPQACGLALRTDWIYQTGGYTYWHRDAPIYFEAWDASQTLDGSIVTLRLESVLGGWPVRQSRPRGLAADMGRFNVMIAARGNSLPGFAKRGCYGRGIPDDREFCVFIRPGGCE